MKRHIITMVLAVCTCAVSFGQVISDLKLLSSGQISDIGLAAWKNSYDSYLKINNINEASGYFTGTYTSTTGATQTCRVIGFVGKLAEDKKSVPISFSIHWKNFPAPSGGKEEKMTSTMTGQIYEDESGRTIMEVYHNLQDPLPNVTTSSDFNYAGNYGQTLTFEFDHVDKLINTPWLPSKIVETDYTGVWHVDTSGGTTTNVNIVAISEDNVVQATYTDNENNQHMLKGFIGDRTGTGNEDPKSISLVGLDHKNNKTLALTGLIGKPAKVMNNASSIEDGYFVLSSWLAPAYIVVYEYDDNSFNRLIYTEYSESNNYHVERLKLNKNKTYLIYVKHNLKDFGFWDRWVYSFLRYLGYSDKFYLYDKNFEVLTSNEIGDSWTKTEVLPRGSNDTNAPDDLVFDALLLKGQSTYVSSSTPAYKTHYSAVKLAGLYMTGPKANTTSIASFELDQKKQPLANYGATEWTSSIAIGNASAQGTRLQFGVDSGGNYNWANSTQCQTNSCKNYGHRQFNPNTSNSFEWINKTSESVSWGPWGSGMANTGRDIMKFLSHNNNAKFDFKLITNFPENNQFNYFWDGALAMPSSNMLMKDGESHFLARLMSVGTVKLTENFPVGFYYNKSSGDGKIEFGNPDTTKYDANSEVTMTYDAYPGAGGAVKYLWTTKLESLSIHGWEPIPTAPLEYFGFDSGSSALKGDKAAMISTLDRVNTLYREQKQYPEISLKMGTLDNGETAEFRITNEEYVPLIGKGDKSGTRQPQIQTLDGVGGLLVQGSTIMSSLYTIFDYGVRIDPTIVDLELYPKQMRAYNLTNGPQIIQPSSGNYHKGKATVESYGISVYPNPLRDNLTINLSSKTQEDIAIVFTDLAGRVIYKTSRKAKIGANLFNLKNSITDPKSIQQQIVILSIKNESGTIDFKEKLLLE